MNLSANYKKIIVIGCPGSGKSTFSKILAQKTNLPLYHIDNIWWYGDWEHISRDELVKQIEEITSDDNWIIDGNYNATLELRLQKCDLVYFLDLPAEICLKSVKERWGKKRSDIPCIENEPDEEFIDFIKNFENNSKPKILSLFDKYKDTEVITFNTRDEVNRYLNDFQSLPSTRS